MPRSLTTIAAFLLLGTGLALLLGDPSRTAPSELAVRTAPPAATSAAPAAWRSPAPSPTEIPAIPPGYRVAMPRLAIDLPIAEGDLDRDATKQRTPEGYAFHYPGSGLPGDRVNCYLYAHARTGMFLSLWDARIGDEVSITTPDGNVLRYVVTEIHPRVPPDDLSWAEPTAPERLTLQTSTGPDPGDPRFIVVAERA